MDLTLLSPSEPVAILSAHPSWNLTTVRVTDVNVGECDMSVLISFPPLHQVNLYSDPPKPARSAQSGQKQGASRLVVLDFPQAQRAETSSASLHPDGRSSHQSTFILPTLSNLSFHGHIIKKSTNTQLFGLHCWFNAQGLNAVP